MSYQEIASLLTQLSLILETGIPLQQGIEVIEGTVDNKLVESLKAGNSLANSLKSIEDFPEYAIGLIETSEVAGNLDITLHNLIDYYTKMDETNYQLKKDMRSSLLLSIMLILVLSITVLTITPLLDNVYQQIGISLNTLAWRSYGLIGILLVIIELAIIVFVFIEWKGARGAREPFYN